MVRYVQHHIDPSHSRLLDVPVPDAIFVVPGDMVGKHFLHLQRVVTFDRGHDWNLSGDKVKLSPAAMEQVWLVFQYGDHRCCDRDLHIGSRFCPQCGQPTSSIVEAA
jgi:hypothetical protein